MGGLDWFNYLGGEKNPIFPRIQLLDWERIGLGNQVFPVEFLDWLLGNWDCGLAWLA